ncbi:uncharacterized protein LOC110043324 isoform X2 [Orbicella faveolata]|uniref:uncharacterized protein LOC110043324 isoform X1 n=1 Tax=Orbicella faveolata TaxID=48498 RepID=UPI0009E44538|nr:uncharacterized protein LOC110043324 isoform X1 [Orbicella faveolata]XP_020604430.1 uncharacterized protein LOC110043324 isoform X2 [Orbicella faveolata]
MACRLLFHAFLSVLLCCFADNTRNPPKIVTKEGNLVLKAGEDGDIVFEPDQGKQVFIGGNVLNVSASAKGEKGDQGIQGAIGSKGEKGEIGPPGQAVSMNGTVNVTGTPGQKGEKGIQGLNGTKGGKGEPGNQGPAGKNGTDGIQGPPGVNGTKGDRGAQGPAGPLFNTLNQTILRCKNSSDYGSVRFISGYLQVCTKLGWQQLAYQDSLCELNVPRMNHEAFQSSTFGVLLQFNGDLLVNFSPNMNLTNMTAEYKDAGGQNITQYIQGIMGQAVQLKQQEYINFQGIPAGFWSGDEWSVMTLVKFHDDGILGIGKENPVLGDGIPATNQGFHLGMKNKNILYGYYSSDIQGVKTLDYDKWYQVTWTWKKSNKMRKIFIDGKLDVADNSKDSYQGLSGQTQIGTWWSGNNGLKTNLEIDTLYIIDKAIEYTPIDQQLCFAKALNAYMP